MTKPNTTQDEYYEWIADIIAGNVERIPEEGYHTVATMCVIAVQQDMEDTKLYYGAEPWTRNRWYPKDIIESTRIEYPFKLFHDDDLRDLAVSILARDLKAMLEGDDE